MIDFLIDNIYIKIDLGNVSVSPWVQTVPLSWQEIIQKVAEAFNLTSRYTDDLITISNPEGLNNSSKISTQRSLSSQRQS